MNSKGSFTCKFTQTVNNEALECLQKQSDNWLDNEVKIDFDIDKFDVHIGDLIYFGSNHAKITKITDTGVLATLVIINNIKGE